MAKKKNAVKAAFQEVFKKTPKIVKKTAKKFGKARAEKQRIAIALAKGRKASPTFAAKYPEKKKK